jgi:hypothetical protein
VTEVAGLLAPVLLLALPSPDLVVAFALGRGVEPGVLVPDAEPAGWEPPFGEPADAGGAAPAIGIAAAHGVAGVVDALEQRPAHDPRVARRRTRSQPCSGLYALSGILRAVVARPRRRLRRGDRTSLR